MNEILKNFLAGKINANNLRTMLLKHCSSLEPIVDTAKSSATEAFKTKNYQTAAELYTACIICTDDTNKELLGNLYSNRSHCYFVQGMYYPALSDAIIAINYNERNYKTWLRLSDAYFGYNDYNSALMAAKKAISYTLNNEYKKIIQLRVDKYEHLIWKEKIKNMYDNNYNRFMTLPDIENNANDISKVTTSDSLEIEYNSNLTDEQKAAIQAQFTQTPQEKQEINLITEFIPNLDKEHSEHKEYAVKFIKTLTQLNVKRNVLDKFIDLHSSELEQRYINLVLNKIHTILKNNNGQCKVCLIGIGSLLLPTKLANTPLKLDIVLDQEEQFLEYVLLQEYLTNHQAEIKWVNIAKTKDKKSEIQKTSSLNDTVLDEESKRLITEGLDSVYRKALIDEIMSTCYDLVIFDPDLFDSFLLNPVYKFDIFQNIPSAKDYIPSRVDIIASMGELDLSNYLLVKQPWCLSPMPLKNNKIKYIADEIKLFSFHLNHWSYGYKSFKEAIEKCSITIDDPLHSSLHLNFTPNCMILSYQLYDTNGCIFNSLLHSNLSYKTRKRSPYVILLRKLSDTSDKPYIKLCIENQCFTGGLYSDNTAIYSSFYNENSNCFPNIFPSIMKNYNNQKLFKMIVSTYQKKIHDTIQINDNNQSINILFFDCRSYSDLEAIIESFIVIPNTISSKFSTVKYKIYCCSTNSMSEIKSELKLNAAKIYDTCLEKNKYTGLKWSYGNENKFEKNIKSIDECTNFITIDSKTNYILNIVKFNKSFIYQTAPKNKQILNSTSYRSASYELFNGAKIDNDDHIKLKVSEPINICFLGGIYYVENEPNPLHTQLLQQALYIRSAFSGIRKTIICPGKYSIFAIPFTIVDAEFLKIFLNKTIFNIDNLQQLKLLPVERKLILHADLNTITHSSFSKMKTIVKDVNWEFENEETVYGIICYTEYIFGNDESTIIMSHAPATIKSVESEQFSNPQQFLFTLGPIKTKDLNVLFTFDNLSTINVKLGNFDNIDYMPKSTQLKNTYDELIRPLDYQYYNTMQFQSSILPIFQAALIEIAKRGLDRGMDYGFFDEAMTYIHTYAL